MSSSGDIAQAASDRDKADANEIDRDQIARHVKKASSSFYWAMRILRKPKRDAIFAVYAFCRAVDDIADGSLELAEKHTRLASWRNQVNKLYDDTPQFSIIKALKQPVVDFNLRREDFMAVIDGMLMDADGPIIAPSVKQLDLYCDRVAAAVGRLCVSIFGDSSDKGLEVAYHQGRALQMTNILRDVAEDASEGRLYLPKEQLAAFNITYTDPQAVMEQSGFPDLWRHLANQAQDHYTKAYAALAQCDRRKMRPAYIMADIYRLNLIRMQAMSNEELLNPLVSKRLVSKGEKLKIALKSIWS